MEYVTTFVKFCVDNWEAITGAAVVIAGLVTVLVKSWKAVENDRD